MLYEAAPFLLSTIVLIAAILLFFVIARGRYSLFGGTQVALRIISAVPLVLSAVVLHFVRTNEATAMMPPIFPSPFPSPANLVIGTGVLEILGAVGLFVPWARRSAALWTAILMVVIFPVNIAVAGQTFGGLRMPGVPARLAMQVFYIWMVLLAGYGLPGGKKAKS